MSKLSIKLQFCIFAGIMLTAVLLVSAIGSIELRDSEKALQSLYKDEMVPMIRLKNMSDAYTVDVLTAARQVDHEWMSFEDGLAEVEKAQINGQENWQAFIADNIHEQELILINGIKPLIEVVNRSTEELKEILRKRDQAALRNLRSETMEVAFHNVHEKLDDLTELQVEIAQEAYLEEIGDFAVAKKIFLGATIAAVVFALLVGLVILRSLNTAIGKMIAQTHQMAAGDLNGRIEGMGDHELGTLAKAFNEMADSLQELVGKVQRSGVQVASSATEIAASIREQQATSTEQAATTSEIFASTKEIASTSKELVKNMDEVTHVADSTSTLAEGGREDLARMENTMNQMMEATNGIASRLAVLSEKAGNINSVITTINKVADQTNLLSLNAAIEAEKAGEHGVGFGVVATEIRRLADQTAVATWDIEQMVKEMQSAVSSGVMGMEKFSEEVRHGVAQVGEVGERLSKIVKSVQSLTPNFESVYQAMQGQSAGSEQMNQALEQLNDTVQGTAEAMLESVAVVDQLNEASNLLQSSVSRFKIKA